MQRDAESHASEDKKKRELVEARNTAEQRVYQLEKLLEEHKDKLGDSDKSALRAAIDKVNEAKKADDVAAINRAVDELSRASQAMSEHLYSAGGPGAGAGGRPRTRSRTKTAPHRPTAATAARSPKTSSTSSSRRKSDRRPGNPADDRGSVLLGRLRPTGQVPRCRRRPCPIFSVLKCPSLALQACCM